MATVIVLVVIVMFITIAWIVPMILCAMVAKQKNQSPAWIFAGLALGWIGLIIVVCLPKKELKANE